MKRLLFSIIFFSIVTIGNALAFDNEVTHKRLTEKAITSSHIDDYLIDKLNYESGTETTVKGFKIKEWLREGSYLEDEPGCRASNHFHNPLNTLSWTESGMSDQPWFVDGWCSAGEYPPANIKSNVHWATGYIEPAPTGTKIVTGNQWDWDHAREYYYIYLTGKDYNGSIVAATQNERDVYFSNSLQALGQVLHLIQDMAVPAHVRNDFKSHLDLVGLTPETVFSPSKWFRDQFEYYVEHHINELVVDSEGGDLAETSLTKFWDTNNYSGDNPSISLQSQSIGLSEYTNINFASKNTVFAEDFLNDDDSSNDVHYNPYPRKSSTNVQEYIDGNMLPKTVIGEDSVPDTSFWIEKTGDGEIIPYFLKPTYFTKPMIMAGGYDPQVFNRRFKIDDKCARNYAEKLIPRAVGYSAGLLDYFFRGKIEVSAPDASIYSIIDGSVIEEGKSQQEIKEIKANVRNISVKEKNDQGEIVSYEPIEEGHIQAVARYKKIPNYEADLSSYPPTWQEIWTEMYGVEYSYSVSAPISIDSLSSDNPGEFVFDFSTDPIPVGITDLKLFVVFKGTLGYETDGGIAVGMKDLNEPMHITALNCTDRFYLDGQLYTADQIKNDEDLKSLVDYDGDDIFNEYLDGEPYIDPHEIDIQVAFYPEGGTFSNYAVTYTAMNPGKFGRVIMLLDDSPFNMRVKISIPYDTDDIFKNYNYPGVKNQFEGDIIYFVPVSFRGIYKHYGTHYYGAYPDSIGLTEDMWPELVDKEPVPIDQ